MFFYIKASFAILMNFFSRKKIFLISEKADWVIKDVCQNISRNINKKHFNISSVTYSPRGVSSASIKHFGSINSFLTKGWGKRESRLKVILTWYHILTDDKRLKHLDKIDEKINFFHTACSMTKNKLVDSGINEEKIVLIPLGVDLNLFQPCFGEEKKKIKNDLKLPSDKIIIGSFQKDGCGWENGSEPKLEKGPDVFCAAVEKLSKKYDIHVLLTGPARGYVKNRLRMMGISFTHHYLKKYSSIVDYYNALDLYLITSRAEGGPKALLECMASRVPLVSTKVGMVPDVIRDGENGFLAEVGDLQEIIKKSEILLENKNLREKILNNALFDVQQFDWSIISEKFWVSLYSKLL